MKQRQLFFWIVISALTACVYPFTYVIARDFLINCACPIVGFLDHTTNGPLRIAIEMWFPNLRISANPVFLSILWFYYFLYIGIVMSPMLINPQGQRRQYWLVSLLVIIIVFYVSINSWALYKHAYLQDLEIRQSHTMHPEK